jgi:hypothetical protein
VSGAPPGLAISRDTGVIAGYLAANAAGKYDLTVKVTDRRTGKQDSLRLPLTVGSVVGKERK